MILKISQKTNANGWRKQAVVDFEKKTIKAGAFLTISEDITKLTAAQYQQFIDYFIAQGFAKVEE